MRANAGRARFLRLFPERDLAGRGFFCNFAAAFHIASLYERDSKENIAADDGGFRNLRLRNTLFIHTHSENGQTVTHSHPYLPGQAHHHSANAFQCIGGANAATFSMLPAAVMSCGDFVPRFMGQIAPLSEKSSGVFENESLTSRGPPAARV